MVTLRGPEWRLEGIRAVLFDKDGTFIDLHRYWGGITQRRAAAMAQHMNWPEEKIPGLERAMGYDRGSGRLLSQGPVGLLPRDAVIGAAAAYLAAEGAAVPAADVADIFSAVHAGLPLETSDWVSPIPEALALLDALYQAGVPLAVVTSDSLAAAQTTLARWDLARYFSLVLGRESCDAPKHTGVPARVALERLGVPAAQTVCIGDAPMDAQMAVESGCAACIGVATGQLDVPALRAYTPYVVESLAHVTVQSRQEALCH